MNLIRYTFGQEMALESWKQDKGTPDALRQYDRNAPPDFFDDSALDAYTKLTSVRHGRFDFPTRGDSVCFRGHRQVLGLLLAPAMVQIVITLYDICVYRSNEANVCPRSD